MRIDLPSGAPAEIALPDGEPRRGVVIAPDIFGLRPLFDEMCGRLAREQSWTVVAVEPFPGREDLDIDGRMAAVQGLDDGRVLDDLVAAADLTECDSVGVIGFCMGGMYTLKAASTGRFNRAAAFYGMIRLPTLWKGPGQAEPLDLLQGSATCPTLAIIGAADPYTPPEDVVALDAVGTHISVAVYPDAEHGFVHDPARPAHRPEDAADAWRKVFDHFE